MFHNANDISLCGHKQRVSKKITPERKTDKKNFNLLCTTHNPPKVWGKAMLLERVNGWTLLLTGTDREGFTWMRKLFT